MTLTNEYEKLGPFEIKDFLAKVATKSAQDVVARLPERRPRQPELGRHRAARGVLPARAVRRHREQARARPAAGRRRHAQGTGHCRPARGLARRSTTTCRARPSCSAMVPWAVKKFGFDADKFVHELVDSIIGDHYPVPDRMLVHNEQIVHEYLQWAMCGEPAAEGQVQDLRGRGRHRRDVLHLQVAQEPTAFSIPATRSRSACRSSRRTSRWRTSRTTTSTSSRCTRSRRSSFSIRMRSSTSSSIRRSRRSSSSTRATRTRWRCQRRHDQEDRRDPQEAAGSDPADRRRLRHVRAGLPFADGRVPEEHHRRLLVQQVLRLHRLAPRHDRACTRTTSSTR